MEVEVAVGVCAGGVSAGVCVLVLVVVAVASSVAIGVAVNVDSEDTLPVDREIMRCALDGLILKPLIINVMQLNAIIVNKLR